MNANSLERFLLYGSAALIAIFVYFFFGRSVLRNRLENGYAKWSVAVRIRFSIAVERKSLTR